MIKSNFLSNEHPKVEGIKTSSGIAHPEIKYRNNITYLTNIDGFNLYKFYLKEYLNKNKGFSEIDYLNENKKVLIEHFKYSELCFEICKKQLIELFDKTNKEDKKVNQLKFIKNLCEAEIKAKDKIMSFIENLIQKLNKPQLEKKENVLPLWFPIGLGFATGKIQKKIKNNISARQIAKDYDLDSYHNYISLTKSNTIVDSKNIYKDWKKLKLVYDYCKKNNIEICTEFEDAYKLKENELN